MDILEAYAIVRAALSAIAASEHRDMLDLLSLEEDELDRLCRLCFMDEKMDADVCHDWLRISNSSIMHEALSELRWDTLAALLENVQGNRAK
ncbi:MAG: hypothetical protein ABSC17_09620 [Thermacetogeniaceae bacterium]